MALTDSDKRLKRIPDNDRTTMKAKADRVLLADLSENDIRLINYGKKHGLTKISEIRETVGDGFNKEEPPTDKEIKGVLEGTIEKPTGKFKKKSWKEKLFG